MKNLDKNSIVLTTPTSDPQDPGFDVFLNYICTRNPTSSEPLLPYLSYPYLPLFWQTSGTNEFFICPDNTADAMIWNKIITDANLIINLPDNLSNLKLGTSRDDTSVSLASNTSRQPNVTNDVELNIDFNFTSLLSTSSTVILQTSPDNSTWTTKRTISLGLGVDSNETMGFNKIIPAGYYYQYIISGTATVTIVNHFELVL